MHLDTVGIEESTGQTLDAACLQRWVYNEDGRQQMAYLQKAMPQNVEQDLRSHDPDVLFLQLLAPSSSVPVVHIHVTTEVGHPEAGVLAQHVCLLQHHNALSQ